MSMITCKGCDQELPKEFFAVDKMRATGRRYKCRACSAAEFKRWQQTSGYEKRLAKGRENRRELKATNPKERWANMAFAAAKTRAKANGWTFSLTKDWLASAIVDRCPLLGIELSYSNTAALRDSAAIDRVDSNHGYVPENCWIISMQANRIKSNATVDEIEAVARSLRAYLDNRGADAVQAKKDETGPPPKALSNPYAA
jgi:hypothetical protein